MANSNKTDSQKTSEKDKKFKATTADIYNKIKQAFRDLGYVLSGTKINIGEDIKSHEIVDVSEADSAEEKKLIASLREMEADYIRKKSGVEFTDPNELLPQTLGGKPLEYDKKSEEEITRSAMEALIPSYTEKVDKEGEKYLKSVDSLEEKRKKLEESESEEREALIASTDKAHREYTDEMIKRGLVNSTIMSYGNELIDSIRDEQFRKYDKEYDLKYTEIRAKIAEAELSYNNALKEFDLKLAADLDAKIAKLTAQESARLKEINEYNRKLAEKEAYYQVKRNQRIASMQKTRTQAIIDAALAEREDEEKNGVSPEKQAEYEKRMAAAKEFYSRYDSDTAMSMMLLSEKELAALLGNGNYVALLGWNTAR